MNRRALGVIAPVMLAFASVAANASLLKFEFSGPTSNVVKWAGPGAPPTSFQLSFTVDSLSFVSSDFAYLDNGEIWTYRFHGVDALSVSFVANGSDLWSDPTGLKLEFGGDYPSSRTDPGGFCFCYLQGSNLLGRSLGITYNDILPLVSLLGADPLATILLAQTPLFGQAVYPVGEWGNVIGEGPVTVSEVPGPAAIWLLGAALGVLGGRLASSRSRGYTTRPE